MAVLPKVCVIGAGSCGLTTCKALIERNIPFDCFEKSDDVGGNWYYKNPNGLSSAYRMLHIDSSKSRMQFSDFPMPDEYPNFAHHSQVFTYFRNYAEHFGIRERVTFNTAVEHAERMEDGTWNITLDNGERRQYDALFVCNGHHWDPRWPEPAPTGEFNGTVIHAHHYLDAEPYRGKKVVVVGMGNSAMDIAVECSYVADRVFLAHRRGTHIVPKYLLGRPVDKWTIAWMPWWIARYILGFMLWLQVGRMEDYGLKKPEHSLFQAHPSVSSVILDRIAHGDIEPRDNIAELEGDRVRFADGKVDEVDVIIYCTGYKVTFPFFDESFIVAQDNDLPLYKRMFKPGMDNLFFIGLVQPLGAIFPIAEQQAVLAAEYLCGRYALPPEERMLDEMHKEREAMFRRYVKSKRHTMEVDFDPFLKSLHQEQAAGRKRAEATGSKLPVTPKAAQAVEA